MASWQTIFLLVLLLIGFTLVTGCTKSKDTQESIRYTDAAVSDLSKALDTGNDAAVLALMTNSSRAQYGGSLNLSAAEEKQLAADLKDADIIETYENAVVYEMRKGNEKLTFLVIKEGESWKVYGL
jgi:hypothetical protein